MFGLPKSMIAAGKKELEIVYMAAGSFDVPAHKSGDLILVIGYQRNGIPGTPAGFTLRTQAYNGSRGNAVRLCSKLGDGTAFTVPSFSTNGITVIVARNADVGAVAAYGNTGSDGFPVVVPVSDTSWIFSALATGMSATLPEDVIRIAPPTGDTFACHVPNPIPPDYPDYFNYSRTNDYLHAKLTFEIKLAGT